MSFNLKEANKYTKDGSSRTRFVTTSMGQLCVAEGRIIAEEANGFKIAISSINANHTSSENKNSRSSNFRTVPKEKIVSHLLINDASELHIGSVDYRGLKVIGFTSSTVKFSDGSNSPLMGKVLLFNNNDVDEKETEKQILINLKKTRNNLKNKMKKVLALYSHSKTEIEDFLLILNMELMESRNGLIESQVDILRYWVLMAKKHDVDYLTLQKYGKDFLKK